MPKEILQQCSFVADVLRAFLVRRARRVDDICIASHEIQQDHMTMIQNRNLDTLQRFSIVHERYPPKQNMILNLLASTTFLLIECVKTIASDFVLAVYPPR